MSADSRIGSALMSRRIELGISLEQAARDTNIRARMIEVLESSDYAQYPPRGHSLGMLSSYARYLGLDSSKVIAAFDREYDEYEASKKIASSADRTRRGVGRFGERATGSKSRPISRDTQQQRRTSSRRRRDDRDERPDSKLTRSLQSEAEAQDQERYKTGSVRIVGKRSTNSFARVQSSSDTGSFQPSSRRSRRGTDSQSHESTDSMRRTRSSSPLSSRASLSGSFSATYDEPQEQEESTAPNFFGVDVGEGSSSTRRSSRRRSAQRNESSDQDSTGSRPDENIIERIIRVVKALLSERRTRIITLCFAVIVIGVIIAASILIGTAGSNNTGIIPVSGGVTNDTTTTDGKNEAHKTITTANGNPVMIKVTVPEGETSVLDISFDGANAYKGAAVGPWSKNFNVTESFSASFSNPKIVTVTENDNPIDIAIGDDGTGSLIINIQSSTK